MTNDQTTSKEVANMNLYTTNSYKERDSLDYIKQVKSTLTNYF